MSVNVYSSANTIEGTYISDVSFDCTGTNFAAASLSGQLYLHNISPFFSRRSGDILHAQLGNSNDLIKGYG